MEVGKVAIYNSHMEAWDKKVNKRRDEILRNIFAGKSKKVVCTTKPTAPIIKRPLAEYITDYIKANSIAFKVLPHKTDDTHFMHYLKTFNFEHHIGKRDMGMLKYRQQLADEITYKIDEEFVSFFDIKPAKQHDEFNDINLQRIVVSFEKEINPQPKQDYQLLLGSRLAACLSSQDLFPSNEYKANNSKDIIVGNHGQLVLTINTMQMSTISMGLYLTLIVYSDTHCGKDYKHLMPNELIITATKTQMGVIILKRLNVKEQSIEISFDMFVDKRKAVVFLIK